MLHCCEAPRSMLFNYFSKKQVLRGTFGEIWHTQIQIYPKWSTGGLRQKIIFILKGGGVQTPLNLHDIIKVQPLKRENVLYFTFFNMIKNT